MEANRLSNTHFTDKENRSRERRDFSKIHRELVTQLGCKPRPFSQHRPPGAVQPSVCFLSALLAIIRGCVIQREPAGMRLSGQLTCRPGCVDSRISAAKEKDWPVLSAQD